jgi:hypothetical protein
MDTIRSLFGTLLLLAAAFLAYDYFLATPGRQFVFKNRPALNKDAPAPLVRKVEEIVQPKAVLVRDSSSAPSASKPAFVPPALPTVEQATMQWTKIPATAFPREVKLASEASFKTSFGASKLSAGTMVTALGFDNGLLTIAPAASSPLRGTAPLDATNLKAILAEAYSEWTMKKIQEVRESWETRQKNQQAEVAKLDPSHVSSDGKPVRSGDGTYPLLVSHLRSGAVTELKLGSIQSWSEATADTVEGKPGWVVRVNFNADTAFGKFPTTALAKIRGGKVVGWFYAGSGEPVP